MSAKRSPKTRAETKETKVTTGKPGKNAAARAPRAATPRRSRQATPDAAALIEYDSWVVQPATEPHLDLKATLLGLLRAEDAVLQVLRRRFPLQSEVVVKLPQHKALLKGVVLDYEGGPQGIVRVMLLGARAITKTKVASVPALEIATGEDDGNQA